MFLNIQHSKSIAQQNSFPHKQRGSMLVMSLFILVVLTMLAGTMITIISGSTKSTVHEVYGVRAQQAAHAGIESLVASSFPVGAQAQMCSTTLNSGSSFSNIPGFANCRFTASCSSSDISFNSANYRYYRYSSTGFCDAGEGVVSRTLYVDAMQEDLP
jgi:MSHA biogenesis protein MshP